MAWTCGRAAEPIEDDRLKFTYLISEILNPKIFTEFCPMFPTKCSSSSGDIIRETIEKNKIVPLYIYGSPLCNCQKDLCTIVQDRPTLTPSQPAACKLHCLHACMPFFYLASSKISA